MFEDVNAYVRERTLRWLRWIRVRTKIGEIYAETLDDPERVWAAYRATDNMCPAPDIQPGTPQWAYQRWLSDRAWSDLDDRAARAFAEIWVENWRS